MPHLGHVLTPVMGNGGIRGLTPVRIDGVAIRSFSFLSDDEVGGLESAIRAERAQRVRQSTRIALRRAEEERGDTHFVSERRRSRRARKRDPRGASAASEAIKLC
jgi:hypothetical protein